MESPHFHDFVHEAARMGGPVAGRLFVRAERFDDPLNNGLGLRTFYRVLSCVNAGFNLLQQLNGSIKKER